MDRHEHPFYDTLIFPDREQEHIERVLKKYRKEIADEKLQEKIWNELQELKHQGKVKIPFKVVLRKDPKYPYVEVILDTKV